MTNFSNITYIAHPEHHKFFFVDKLYSVVEHLGRKVGPKTQIYIYPDATLKSNNLPTGIACIAKEQDTLLLPFVLRDPGCGYLSFKLDFKGAIQPGFQEQIGLLLEDITNPKKPTSISHELLNNILHSGLDAYPINNEDKAGFLKTHFPLDVTQVTPTSAEFELLAEDFRQVTNTIEIRKPYSIESSSILADTNIGFDTYIGFIHSGSHAFPKILAKRFVYNIAEYADSYELATLDEIEAGIFGVPLSCQLGQEYYQWLQAAMNYALVNRYAIFQALKQSLESTLPCTISLINDNPHAGVFSKEIGAESYIYQTRGVQHVYSSSEAGSRQGLSVLAGQRESIAALVTGTDKSAEHFNLFSHGLSYEILPDYQYQDHFSSAEQLQCQQFAQETYYNTAPDFSACLPATFNLHAELEYFSEINLAKPVAYLSPWINVQSDWLKTSEIRRQDATI